MENLFIILGVLFISLFAFIKLTENTKPIEEEKVARMSRWIMPLVMALVVIQIIRYYFF